jgi:hypothetical protein
MVLNAPLGHLERIWRSLAAKTVYTMHFVAVWAGFVALRDAYVLERTPGMLTDLAGSVLYYFTASIMGVSAQPPCSSLQWKSEESAFTPVLGVRWCPQIVMLYIEGALFQHLSTGIERVAACYHVSPSLCSLFLEPAL